LIVPSVGLSLQQQPLVAPFSPPLGQLMRVFHYSVMQRNVTQRKSFYATKSVCVAYFFTQPQTPQRRLRLLAALRKQIESTSIFSATPEANSTNQPVAPAVRNGAVLCVKRIRKMLRRCGTLR